jgi:hypothetical protein
VSAAAWPWFALAGLGLFHGLNPAMGWLFAVALGLYRKSARVVAVALIPIAAGHALAVALALGLVLGLGLMVGHDWLHRLAGALLIGWALWHLAFGHRGTARIGMRTGYLGLGLWSFLMASAHGAGLMLVPVLLPICSARAGAHAAIAPSAWPIALAALAVHSAVMLATIAAVSLSVYRWIGLGFLRKGWINLDLVWTAALAACGVLLLAM